MFLHDVKIGTKLFLAFGILYCVDGGKCNLVSAEPEPGQQRDAHHHHQLIIRPR